MGRLCVIGLTVLLAWPTLAQANCERDLADVKAMLPQIKDDKARMRAHYYVVRADRELDEGDEFDCQSAVDAVTKLLPGLTATAP